MKKRLEEKLAAIQPIKEEFLSLAQARLDHLTKPVGSLGQLEELAKRYAAMVEKATPAIQKKIIYTFAADHGVTKKGSAPILGK